MIVSLVVRRSLVPAFALALATMGTARAAVVANGPDDICPPSADPCLIDDKYDVQAPGGLLDFGLRTVRIVAGGRIESTATVLCGSFSIDVGATEFGVDTQQGLDAGAFTVRARRACSGDGTTPCLDDSSCGGLGLGSCSVGDGSIIVGGKISSRGDPGGDVTLEAVADVSINAIVTVAGSGIGKEAGRILLRSYKGSIETTATLRAESGEADLYNFEPFIGGSVELDAAFDVSIGAAIEINRAAHAGELVVTAGRDVFVRGDVNANADTFAGAEGGTIEITAAGDLLIAGSGSAGTSTTRLSTNGDSRFYYLGGYPGNGGYQTFVADTITVDEHAIIQSDSGRGAAECFSAYGGELRFLPARTLVIDGQVEADGKGCLVGGTTIIDAPEGVTLGEKGLVRMRSKVGGNLRLSSNGNVDLDGQIDVRGYLLGGVGYYAYHGYGGEVTIEGGMDLRISGDILSGGDAGSAWPITIGVCRLDLVGKGSIDQSHGAPASAPFVDVANNVLRIGESMTAESTTSILHDTSSGARNLIRYRDPQKPPILAGTVAPAPDLAVDPSLAGCPVCGNLEIDQGESCDDGNGTSGDGCRDDCQDEGCLAESPGFPGVALCDDGDACTVDRCDPVAHACTHVLSCEEGIPCTADACVGGACEHLPDDLLCDDGNDCTDDLCSTATGCVYADLTGPACEDGDLCTITGTCAAGVCIADDTSFADTTKLSAKFRSGPANDRVTLKLELALSKLATAPSTTGLSVELRDAADMTVFAGSIPAAAFVDQGGAGTKFKFRDPRGEVSAANGMQSALVKVLPSKGVAKVSVKIKDTEVPGIAGQQLMSASLLFGSDPSVDDCVTARRIPCTPKTTSNRCRN